MNRSLEKRLRELEGADGGQIPVWCDGDGEFAAEVERMIGSGEISPRDRYRCVSWETFSAGSGAHEAALTEMEKSTERAS